MQPEDYVLDEADEVMTQSDSSEWKHYGDGTPCENHNCDGCKNGSQCKFKHAPDTLTVRDELYVISGALIYLLS